MDAVAIVGLDYVGLPSANKLGKVVPTIRHDLFSAILKRCRGHSVPCDTVDEDGMSTATQLNLSLDPNALTPAGHIIVALSAPTDPPRQLDSGPLIQGSESAGREPCGCMAHPHHFVRRAEMLDDHPQAILTGNPVKGARVNVLGSAFEEDVPDLRNSGVWDLISELRSYGIDVFVHDPADAQQEYGLTLLPWEALPQAHAVVVAVSHAALLQKLLDDYLGKTKPQVCFVGEKSRFVADALQTAGLRVWRL